MEFEVSSEARDGVVLVRVRGDVDLATAPRLDEVLTACWQPSARLVIDATDIPFMDSTGLGVLVKAAVRAREAGGSVALVAVASRVRKVLAITGLDTHLAIYDTVADAVRAT